MDAVSLKLARNYTNEKLNSLPSNAPTKTVTFDGGIYSVGSDVVNGQVSVTVKGMTLKNELNYNYQTMAGWLINTSITQKVTGGFIGTHNGINYVSARCYVNIKNSTKYGLLLYVSKNTSNAPFLFDPNAFLQSKTGINLGNTVGNKKSVFTTKVFTTKENISIKYFQLYQYPQSSGEIAFQDIRLFELPAGSEIENDFETLTADELAQKYPYISGGSAKSTVGAMRLKSVGKNLFDKSKVLINKALSRQGNIINLNGSYVSDFIPVSEKLKYTCQKARANANNVGICFYDENKRYIGGGDYSPSNPYGDFYWTEDKFYLKSMPEGTKYVRFTILTIWTGVDNDLDLVQFEEGTVATEYEPYKESIVNVNLPEPLRSLPNDVKDEVNVTTGVKTQNVSEDIVVSDTVYDTLDTSTYTNVDVVITTAFADAKAGTTGADGQTHYYNKDGVELAEVAKADIDLEASAGKYYWGEDKKLYIIVAKGDYADIAAARTGLDATSLNYQLAEPIITKLPAQPPLQVYENGTVYVEPLGDPSETTVPNVEMTIPTGTSNKFGVATHDYGGAAADWVLTNSESKCFLLAVSNAGGSANIIAPDAPGVMYAISNASGQTVTVKISGGTGVAITNAKTVLVIHNGTDYTALTAEL